jgi:hypothetical protein
VCSTKPRGLSCVCRAQCLKAVGIVEEKQRHVYKLDMKKFGKNVAVFLNRLLGLQLHDQKMLFHYFQQTHAAFVQEAKAEGTWDDGAVSLKNENIVICDGCASLCPARVCAQGL